MPSSYAVMSICRNNFIRHVTLRCSLGLSPTCINNCILEKEEEVYDFVETILLSSLRSYNVIKNQILAMFLYTTDERKLNLAQKILSLNLNNFSIFLLIIHALFFMDITNMEREGPFYDYLLGILGDILDNTEMKNLIVTSEEIAICRRQHMRIFLSDFSHFLSLFVN